MRSDLDLVIDMTTEEGNGGERRGAWWLEAERSENACGRREREDDREKGRWRDKMRCGGGGERRDDMVTSWWQLLWVWPWRRHWVRERGGGKGESEQCHVSVMAVGGVAVAVVVGVADWVRVRSWRKREKVGREKYNGWLRGEGLGVYI